MSVQIGVNQQALRKILNMTRLISITILYLSLLVKIKITQLAPLYMGLASTGFNPFRALLVLGSRSSGKSYFVISHVITQQVSLQIIDHLRRQDAV